MDLPQEELPGQPQTTESVSEGPKGGPSKEFAEEPERVSVPLEGPKFDTSIASGGDARSSTTSPKKSIILHVLCVSFHHRNGPQVELALPAFPGTDKDADEFEPDGSRAAVGLPEEWSFLVYLYKKSYILLNHSLSPSCVYLMELMELLTKSADVTRSSVQKAVVILATEPVLGSIRTTLRLVTQALFAQRDFSKMDILEILFFGHRVEQLSSYQYSLISFFPDLLRTLEDVGSPLLSYHPMRESELGSSPDLSRQKLHRFGLPLRIFGEVDNATIEVADSALISAMSLTGADRRFIDDDPSLNSQMCFEGSDDDIRSRFESYLLRLLASVKYSSQPPASPEVSEGGTATVAPKQRDVLSEFNLSWVKMWQQTQNYKLWNERVSADIATTENIGHPKEGTSAMAIFQNSVAQKFSEFSKTMSSSGATPIEKSSELKGAEKAYQLSRSLPTPSSMLSSVSGWMARRREGSNASTAPRALPTSEEDSAVDGQMTALSLDEENFVQIDL
ncbi:late secretory pathway protein avl9 [Dinochytrium kinnereticum]|nr:late secretory pathway protein avl9 [Dinochytrium kinnereticum]